MSKTFITELVTVQYFGPLISGKAVRLVLSVILEFLEEANRKIKSRIIVKDYLSVAPTGVTYNFPNKYVRLLLIVKYTGSI